VQRYVAQAHPSFHHAYGKIRIIGRYESEACDARDERREAHERQEREKVTSRKQAVAIGLSEARKAGGKAPKVKN
jgi:hypothetical protein